MLIRPKSEGNEEIPDKAQWLNDDVADIGTHFLHKIEWFAKPAMSDEKLNGLVDAETDVQQSDGGSRQTAEQQQFFITKISKKVAHIYAFKNVNAGCKIQKRKAMTFQTEQKQQPFSHAE